MIERLRPRVRRRMSRFGVTFLLALLARRGCGCGGGCGGDNPQRP
jgi:hypothetical protein